MKQQPAFVLCDTEISLEVTTLLSYLQKPIYQGLLFLMLNTIALPIVRPANVENVYTMSGILYALFILINSIFVLSAQQVWPYFFSSLLVSVVYIMIAFLLCNAFINYIFKYEGSGEASMIFLVIMYHPIALLILMFIKWLYLKFTA